VFVGGSGTVPSDRVEVALALPGDADGDPRVDAIHLTWRTLPIAVIVRSDHDLPGFSAPISEAVVLISEQEHDVKRDNDLFIRSRRESHPSAVQEVAELGLTWRVPQFSKSVRPLFGQPDCPCGER